MLPASSRLVLMVSLLWCCSTTVLITQPAITPYPDNELEYWFGNFGVIHYNKPMSFDLFITNFSLCGQPEEDALKQFTRPTYMVVRDGGCSYPRKAIKAQSLGAQGVIFASEEVNYALNGVVIADDGTGVKVQASILFVHAGQFQKLEALTNPRIKVNFPITRSQTSQVNIFLSASGRKNYIFLRNFRKSLQKVQESINLNIFYHTIECKGCLESECILQNTCCTFDMDRFESGNGRFILYEQFRQYNLFMMAKQQNNLGKWFDYMNKFDQLCDYDWKNSEECSAKIQSQLGFGKIKRGDQFAQMMEWRRVETKTGVNSFPELSVNGIRHTEMLTADSAYEMVCASLNQGARGCEEEAARAESNKTGIIIVVVVSSAVLVLVGIFCYRSIIRREITNDMSSKVNELVAKYAAKVSEQKKKRRDKMIETMSEEL